MSLREKFNTVELYEKRLPLQELYFSTSWENSEGYANGVLIQPQPAGNDYPLPVAGGDTLLIVSKTTELQNVGIIKSSQTLNNVQREIDLLFFVTAPLANYEDNMTNSRWQFTMEVDVREVGSGVWYPLGVTVDQNFGISGNGNFLNSGENAFKSFFITNAYGVAPGVNNQFFVNLAGVNKPVLSYDAYRMRIMLTSNQAQGNDNPLGMTFRAGGADHLSVIYNSINRLK